MTEQEKEMMEKKLRSHCSRMWLKFKKSFIAEHVPETFKVGTTTCHKCGQTNTQGLIQLYGDRLVEAIKDTVVDIDRMRSLHIPEGNDPDKHKFSGFLAKWIAKTKPVVVFNQGGTGDPPIELSQINAEFAYFIFNSFLEHPVPENLKKHVVYTFHKRDDEKGETLSIMAYSCEEMSRLNYEKLKLEEKIKELEAA